MLLCCLASKQPYPIILTCLVYILIFKGSGLNHEAKPNRYRAPISSIRKGDCYLLFHSIAVFASFIKYQSKLEECQIFITCAISGFFCFLLEIKQLLVGCEEKALKGLWLQDHHRILSGPPIRKAIEQLGGQLLQKQYIRLLRWRGNWCGCQSLQDLIRACSTVLKLKSLTIF
ncbi:hypothetical protein OIU78_003906 [Salix suchowensis]|nr:hypothetical protein OIU78_003906 [Salix suchowensis]